MRDGIGALRPEAMQDQESAEDLSMKGGGMFSSG